MKMFLTIILCFLLPLNGHTQDKKHDFFADEDVMFLNIDLSKSDKSIDSLLKVAGLDKVKVKDLRIGKLKVFTDEHWKVQSHTDESISLTRPLNFLTAIKKEDLVHIINGIFRVGQSPGYDTYANYGINIFDKKNVQENSDGITTFFLEGYPNAQKVFLSGSFNEWSHTDYPMQKVARGWEYKIKLPPGKHLYKYIIDQKWIHDPQNKQKSDDGYYGYNSIYFSYNSKFQLKGFENAKKVILSGSFNNWNEKELNMHKVNGGWELPLFVKEGRQEYKFIVDGNWITDPENPNRILNEVGTYNSVRFTGESVKFSVSAVKASEVKVSGSFIGWNPDGISLKKNNNVWEVETQIPAGNHQYRFIVDGEWMMDKQNPHTAADNGIFNSLLVVNPNQKFLLKGHESAKIITVSGDFNNWDLFGYQLKKVEEGWEINLNLSPGKHRYKFVVDGKWVLDPANKLFEPNGEGDYNSILWVKN